MKKKMLRVLLTQGAIDNGYINFLIADSIFPDGSYGDKSGQQKGSLITIRDDLGKTYHDDVRKSGNTARLRARFGSLFKAVKARTGDIAELTMTGPNEYRLRVLPSGILPMPDAETPADRFKQSLTDIENQYMPANIILHGPPGTGKTFKTAHLAVGICDGAVPDDRELLMARYEQLRQDGRISFVTFHQSYGYEDFVEGLRPESRDGQVTYRVRPGIFREVCDAARLKRQVKPGLSGTPLRERQFYKMSLGISGSAEGNALLQHCLQNNQVLLGWGADVDFSECKSSEDIQKKLSEEQPDMERPDVHERFVRVLQNELSVGDIIIISQGNKAFRAIGEIAGGYEFSEEGIVGDYHQIRPVRWLAVLDGNQPVSDIYDRNFQQSTLYRLDNGGLKFDVLEGLVSRQAEPGMPPYVLIIDEINRANISKVFGELITLLEPDKREGETNALTVKLTYSGTDFTVPSNLHVIGTMNTADRSIALLDTALRRRFEFEELMPDYTALPEGLIDGVDLRTMLRAINARIEYLYDRDHTIGHAYFVKVTSLAELDQVFRRKVIPLMQEYFYENWARIRAVLNDSSGDFIQVNNEVPKGLAADDFVYEARPRYNVNDLPFLLSAFRKIYE